MIQFRAQMYNVTSGEWYDATPRYYTFGYHSPDDTPELINSPGQEVTTIPLASFQFDATNVGIWFEFYAKEYYYNNNAWPVLRCCTEQDTFDNYYMEWSHDSPTALMFSVNGNNVVLYSIFQWSDTVGEEPSQRATYRSFVFLTADSKADLEENLFFFGAVRVVDEVGATTLVGYSGYNFATSGKIMTQCNLLELMRYRYAGSTVRVEKSGPNGPYIVAFFTTASGHKGIATIAPCTRAAQSFLPPWNGALYNNGTQWSQYGFMYKNQYMWCGYQQVSSSGTIQYVYPGIPGYQLSIDRSFGTNNHITEDGPMLCDIIGIEVTMPNNNIYQYLSPPNPTPPGPDPSDVDPDNPPDPDEPPDPIPPDNPDPYYDPTSDPDNPEYDPTKDPDSPEYDPDEPATPYRPPSTEGGGDPPVKPPEDPVTPPPTPPSHAINSRFVTLYTPSLSQLNDLAAYLWSPAWSIDGFKKIFANPMDCILGLMIFPALVAPSGSKEVNVGNLSTGVTMSYIDNQYVEVNCGSFEITEYYASYLDYDPYTKIEIYLPYIGTHRLSADDVMAKTIQLKYMIDLLSGACVAFLVVDGTTLYTFTGSCATPIPVSGNDWSNMVNGILSVAGAATAAVISGGTAATMAAGALASTSLFVSSHKEHIRHGGSVASAAGLMSIQTPYLIVTRPRQALPIGQNSFQGYPSFMTESLGSLSGYTEVESCHLEHIPCTDEELTEIERLLKGGVLF